MTFKESVLVCVVYKLCANLEMMRYSIFHGVQTGMHSRSSFSWDSDMSYVISIVWNRPIEMQI